MPAGSPGQRPSWTTAKHNDEIALVRRVQQGDELAFREIVERYQAKVHSIIYGILRNRNDAEDIAQQVFAKVYFSIGSFDSRSSLLTWIYKITVNECYDYLRKRRVRKLVYESDYFGRGRSSAWRGRMRRWTSRPTVENELARRDYVVKLLSRVSEEDRNLLAAEGGGRSLRGGTGGDDRNESEYDQGEAVPRPAETGEGGAAADSPSRAGTRDAEPVIAGGRAPVRSGRQIRGAEAGH